MKKILTLLFLLALALSVVVACRDGAEGGDETTAKTDAVTTDAATTDAVTTEEPETEAPVTLEGADGAVIDDTSLHGWFDYGSALYYRDKFTVAERNDIAISMAKNEKEGFQYILASCQDYDDLRCEVSTLTDGNGNSLEGDVYVAWNVFVNKAAPYNYSRGFVPSAILPLDHGFQGGS
ncbi:MAG: hypothetical protein IJD10_00405, partial [Clostridia bacterium]|nr:hypothetical protein [Clostridia bacterium]